MSFTFSVAAPEPPDYQTLLDGVDCWDLRCEEEEPDAGPWPEGTLHFYRDAVSARGIEVTLEDGSFNVRILTLASPEDYELARRFVESAALLLKQPVEPEDGDPFPVEELRQRHGEEWSRATNEGGARVMRALVKGEVEGADEASCETLTLSGPHRPFYFGPRVLREIEEGGPEEEFLDRLTAKMLEVQNVDGDEYYFANTMQAKPPGAGEDDEGFTFAVWGPGVYYLMPKVEYIALVVGEDDPPVFIPFDKLTEIVPDGAWSYLDEDQLLVEAIPEAEWGGVVERARAVEVSPLDGE